MRGLLDRFSVDLDFDFIGNENELTATRKKMEDIFSDLGLEVKDKSRRVPQYFLKYPAAVGERNTLKIDIAFPPPKSNKYEAMRFSEIDRIITCQTSETMFANKLVALVDRHDKNESIAGRDVYDIHHFFENGMKYDADVIKERTNDSVQAFFNKLIVFIDKKVTDELVSQDLNVLLPYAKFKVIRKTLRLETLMFLKDELKRIESRSKARPKKKELGR